MMRSTIYRWGIVVCIFCCGCGTTRGSMLSSWWGGNDAEKVAKKGDESTKEEKVASINPFKREKKKPEAEKPAATETAAKNTDAKPADKPAAKPADPKPAGEPATKLATHNTDTLKLIDDELKDATPEERERLYNEWKSLDGAMLKQVIGIRRMVRQMGQNSPTQQLAANNPANPTPNPNAFDQGIKIEPAAAQIAGAGHSSGQHTASRTAPSPLGASPWSQNGNDAHRALAQNTPPAGMNPDNGLNTNPAAKSFNDPRIIPASGTQLADASSAQNSAQYATSSTTQPATPYGNGFAPAAAPANSPGGLTISPGPRQNGQIQQVSATAPAFNGSVSTNGGPQVATNSQPLPGGLSPYNPNQTPPTASPTGIIPVAAQSTDPTLPGGNIAQAQALAPASVPPAVTTPAQSGLAALGMGRLFNGATAAPAPSGSASQASAATAKWNEDLQRLITNAAADVAQTGPGATDLEKQAYIEKHVYLRMLFLMAGQHVRAMEPIPGIDAAEQEFWQQVFWGISSYFDSAAIPDPLDRATQTTLQLRGALSRLQEKARLELRNVNFCHKISSYGNYERFQRDEFSPGQPVLIYAEVGNFKSEQSTDGPFRTLLKSTIEIYNSRGELIQTMPFPATEDLCQNQRRDYFHSYEFTIPQKVAIGPHVMKLTVEDQISQKVATYTLNFTVK